MFSQSSVPEGYASVNVNVKSNTKPSQQRDKKLVPMAAKHLKLNTTHKGKTLMGTIIEPPFYTGMSNNLLVQDFFGGVVEVSIIDQPAPVRSVFQKGVQVAVLEPYFKTRADGTQGIRVENHEEFVMSTPAIESALDWKDFGNQFFDKSVACYDLANTCYEKSLARMKTELKDLSILYSNIALCHMKLAQASEQHSEGLGTAEWEQTLRWASVAIRLDPKNVKAAFRQVAAMYHLGGSTKEQGKNMLVVYCATFDKAVSKDLKEYVEKYSIDLEKDKAELNKAQNGALAQETMRRSEAFGVCAKGRFLTRSQNQIALMP